MNGSLLRGRLLVRIQSGSPHFFKHLILLVFLVELELWS